MHDGFVNSNGGIEYISVSEIEAALILNALEAIIESKDQGIIENVQGWWGPWQRRLNVLLEKYDRKVIEKNNENLGPLKTLIDQIHELTQIHKLD